jgi:hypothetical protein
LLHREIGDKVAAAIIPPDELNGNGNHDEQTLLQ